MNDKPHFSVLFKINKMQYNNYSHGRVGIFDRDVIISFCVPQPFGADYFLWFITFQPFARSSGQPK